MKQWMMIKVGCAVLVGLWLGTGWATPIIKLGAHAPQTGGLAKHGMEQMKGVRVGAEEFFQVLREQPEIAESLLGIFAAEVRRLQQVTAEQPEAPGPPQSGHA